jgi:hypothetical protein
MPISERDLEEPFEHILETGLARELTRGAQDREVCNTARGGVAGGQWTKPDIVVASVRRYLSRAAPELSLHGFELKTREGFHASSLYQAFAHTRFFHYAYVVVNYPDDETWRIQVGEVRGLAEELGVGLIRMDRAHRESSVDVIVLARQQHPEPHRVDHFIEERMPDLAKWVRDRLRSS